MKKMFFICIALFFVVLAGCQNQQTHSTDNQDKKSDTHASNTEKKQTHSQHQSKETAATTKEAVPDKKTAYKMKDNWYLTPIDAEANEKVVLLTIDDAPDKHALEMAKTLKALNVKAIFFVNGHFLESDKKKAELKQIHDMGFTIGNHTYSHAFLPDISAEEQKKEIIKVNDMVENIIGERPQFFRAPNGANTDVSRQIAKDQHMTLMNWSYGYDFMPEYADKAKLTEIMLHTNLLGNGANLLMHDRDWTNKALKDIVTGLKKKGIK
ncbi:polysaccharide deacetylase family protein [Virgibacillus sp. 179-BFC.A HS]|uniref:Polysaccharide deacetylase family protein n=1 Tax=Tigheibacillus jepli TaxID=3035914 RepID=A0ABU5CKH0_9BACI|nr:polysaccharide deacetylase family protein [Virgibacillus sp. 179-BFC.A HS]MDY0406013.1 polysaccharide deacetylase family protein [Virgibacillus sp. 179-BFC.A HS]